MRPQDAKKPAPPFKDFPLFPHQCGQWAKKIRGHTRYFGSWADWRAALDKYLAERDDLYAGRTPRPQALSVRDICNRFLASKRLAVDAGEMSPHTWRDYFHCCVRLRDAMGNLSASQVSGADFEAYRGPAALAAEIQRVRGIFRYAFAEGLIETPTRFGTGFATPPRKALRRARREAGPKFVEAGVCRKLISAADAQMRAMILLALNCGFGQSDLGQLPVAALDLRTGWAVYPRPKTEVGRRAKLWPETVAAVQAAMAARPTPRNPLHTPLLFLTKFGNPWTRTRPRDPARPDTPIDVIGLEFRRLAKGLGVYRKGISFYALRHSYRTIADECLDQRAVDLTMGHADEHVSARYVERVDDARLERVAESVRRWLFPEPKKRS
jgi:integrase